jgi:hypothetical protein
MSYDIQTERPRRNKAGGGMFFLIILAVGAYLIFSNLGRAPQPREGTGVLERDNGMEVESDFDRQARAEQEEFERKRDEILGDDESVAGKQMPSTGKTGAASGWDMEDVATQKNASSPAKMPTNSKTQSKTRNGDWQMEEVETKKKNDNQFQFSNQKSNPPAKPKSDWEIEDVDAKKKTEKGDWAIEETNTEKKKN